MGRQTKHDPTIDQVSTLYLLRLRAFFTFIGGSARGRERPAPSATPVVFLTRRTKKKNRECSSSSVDTALIKTFLDWRMFYSKSQQLEVEIFRYFSFTFYLQFILLAGK